MFPFPQSKYGMFWLFSTPLSFLCLRPPSTGIFTTCVLGLNQELVLVLYDASHCAVGPGHTANVLCALDVAGYAAPVLTNFRLNPFFGCNGFRCKGTDVYVYLYIYIYIYIIFYIYIYYIGLY